MFSPKLLKIHNKVCEPNEFINNTHNFYSWNELKDKKIYNPSIFISGFRNIDVVQNINNPIFKNARRIFLYWNEYDFHDKILNKEILPCMPIIYFCGEPSKKLMNRGFQFYVITDYYDYASKCADDILLIKEINEQEYAALVDECVDDKLVY